MGAWYGFERVTTLLRFHDGEEDDLLLSALRCPTDSRQPATVLPSVNV